MHIRIRHIIVLALIVGAAYAGDRYEATRIQATCEDANAVTRINGSAYVCLPGAAWNALVARMRGREA